MKKHIIWSSNINMDDWKDFLDEEYPDAEEYERFEIVSGINADYLDDEHANLNISLCENIIVIASLGLWNGRRTAYTEIGNNISDCLYSDCDFGEWYVDSRKNLRFDGIHHDGSNHYLYRQWRENLSEEQKDNFREKLYYGTVTSKDITRYTRRIGDKIAEVHGW